MSCTHIWKEWLICRNTLLALLWVAKMVSRKGEKGEKGEKVKEKKWVCLLWISDK